VTSTDIALASFRALPEKAIAEENSARAPAGLDAHG
jgi:hypothetical protein